MLASLVEFPHCYLLPKKMKIVENFPIKLLDEKKMEIVKNLPIKLLDEKKEIEIVENLPIKLLDEKKEIEIVKNLPIKLQEKRTEEKRTEEKGMKERREKTNEEYQYTYLETYEGPIDLIIEALKEASIDCPLFQPYNQDPKKCRYSLASDPSSSLSSTKLPEFDICSDQQSFFTFRLKQGHESLCLYLDGFGSGSDVKFISEQVFEDICKKNSSFTSKLTNQLNPQIVLAACVNRFILKPSYMAQNENQNQIPLLISIFNYLSGITEVKSVIDQIRFFGSKFMELKPLNQNLVQKYINQIISSSSNASIYEPFVKKLEIVYK